MLAPRAGIGAAITSASEQVSSPPGCLRCYGRTPSGPGLSFLINMERFMTYEKPSVTPFGTFRDLTLSGYGPLSDGGCGLGCNNTGQLECPGVNARS